MEKITIGLTKRSTGICHAGHEFGRLENPWQVKVFWRVANPVSSIVSIKSKYRGFTMTKYLFFLLFLLNVTSIKAQDSTNIKFGLGITIVDIKDLANTLYSYHSFGPNFSLPILINDKIKIEPSFGYYNRNIELKPKLETEYNETRKLSDSNIHIGLGFFYIYKISHLSIYCGSHFIYIISKEKETYKKYDNTENGYGYSIAPSIGSEYFFSDHFSIGGELQFKYILLKREQTSGNYSDDDLYFITYDSFVTRTLLVLRFYL